MSDEPTSWWWRITLLTCYCWKMIYSAAWWPILIITTITRAFVPLWEISRPWTEAETVEGEVVDQWSSAGLCASGRMLRASSCCGGTVWSRRCTLSSRTASCALCALEAIPVSGHLTQGRKPQADLSDRDQVVVVVVAAAHPQKSCLWSGSVETLEVRRSRPQLRCEGGPHVDLSGYFPVLPLYFHSPRPQLFQEQSGLYLLSCPLVSFGSHYSSPHTEGPPTFPHCFSLIYFYPGDAPDQMRHVPHFLCIYGSHLLHLWDQKAEKTKNTVLPD